jgi:hypothetical protein
MVLLTTRALGTRKALYCPASRWATTNKRENNPVLMSICPSPERLLSDSGECTQTKKGDLTMRFIHFKTLSGGAGILALMAGVLAQPAHAQYAYGPYGTYSYAPYVYNGPLGGYLSGAADVIHAQSQAMTETQRAQLLREQVEQARIDTRRQLFEERKYERANTPTPQEEREATRERELRRALRTPALADIWSGGALNHILEDIGEKQARGTRGPTIDLDPENLKRLNVTTGAGGSPGILKEKLAWPLPLLASDYEAERKSIEEMLGQLGSQARADAIDRSLLPELHKHVATLRERLRSNVRELSPTEYIESFRYLGHVNDAIKALKEPQAVNYFNDKWTAKGATVDELVRRLKEQGLRFAPAVPGNESAYLAMHAALAAYDGSLPTELKAALP